MQSVGGGSNVGTELGFKTPVLITVTSAVALVPLPPVKATAR